MAARSAAVPAGGPKVVGNVGDSGEIAVGAPEPGRRERDAMAAATAPPASNGAESHFDLVMVP